MLLSSARLGIEGLKQFLDTRDEKRLARFKSVDDLTFGETLRAFENKEVWAKLNLELDRKTVLKNLERVRVIRNHVTHFHPDGISEEDRKTLGQTRNLFQNVWGISAVYFSL